jgi:hypothetical protein
MGLKQSLSKVSHKLVRYGAILALVCFLASNCGAQTAPADQTPEAQALQKLGLDPALMAEFGQLMEKLQRNVQYPAGRSESRLMLVLPETTLVYAAFPNYGDAAHQALQIFKQELKENSTLRDWWHRGDMATTGPKIEDALEKFYLLSEFLGKEVVASGTSEGHDPKLLIVAEIRKPSLKQFLEQFSKERAGKSVGLRVFDPMDLATARELRPGQEFGVLVRPDFVAGALDLTTLRNFNTRMDRSGREFAGTPFGQRIAQAYQDRVMILEAADLQKILKLIPNVSAKDQLTLERTGFADMKYLVWQQADLSGQALSQGELSFTGPRHGVASWLAAPAPAPLGSLDFVSPRAMIVSSIVLKNPAQIFDDVKELATASNPNAFAMLDAFEQSLKLSLREDLLGQLGGEVTAELDDYTPTQPVWKAILRVKDPAHLQQTLTTLMTVTNIKAVQSEDAGVTYYAFQVLTAKKNVEVAYAFVDGYLVAGSSREIVAKAVLLHKNGESLGKSAKFLASLPPGHPSGISGLFYEDPVAVTKATMRELTPDMAGRLAQYIGEGKPIMGCAYGEETAIRGAGGSPAFSAGVVMVVAAAAIPNLLRSRIAADEASAVGSIRTVNTAEVTYAAIYPEKGYAHDLATLGPDPGGTAKTSADHADLLNETHANASCTAGTWCTKSGYLFRITGVCKQHLCKDYVVVGTPVSTSTGTRSFCSTSDAVIRYKAEVLPQDTQLSVKECQAWAPLE